MTARLTGLDGLRGIAALAVFGHHLFMFTHGESRGAAYLSVDLFFMLSGYVMGRTYEARWTGAASAGGFVAARVRRLWPTMTVGGLIMALALCFTQPVGSVIPMLLNIAFVPYFQGSAAFPLNGPAWSIVFELVANLVHVLILCRLSTRVLLALAVATVPWLIMVGADYGFDVGSRPENFLSGFPRVLLSYTLGIVLWRSWRDVPPVKVPPSLAFAAMPLFFGLSALFPGAFWPANLGFIVLLCPLMIAGALRLSDGSRWAAPAALAGALSFPLYAVHAPVMEAVKLAGGVWYASAVAAIAVAALFPPVRRALGPAGRRERKRATQPAPATASLASSAP